MGFALQVDQRFSSNDFELSAVPLVALREMAHRDVVDEHVASLVTLNCLIDSGNESMRMLY
jgi:hypothetical protein